MAKSMVRLIFVLYLICTQASFGSTNNESASVFVTTAGTGPDKWSSIWLIERYLDPLEIRILSGPPSSPVEGITFDYPKSRFNRTGSSSTLSALIANYGVTAAEVIALESFVREMEFEPWKTDKSLESGILEIAFRNMQLRYGRNEVSLSCYLQFFDNFVDAWRDDELVGDNVPDSLIPPPSCYVDPVVLPDSLKISVPEIDQMELLQKLANNEKVLFIDTRETMEFADGHIPASINLKLREVDEATALGLPSADILVAYCVKDFRGYEMARKLRRLGLNAVIMKPYGIKGWIDAGLPIAGPRGTSEAEALQQLHLQLGRYK